MHTIHQSWKNPFEDFRWIGFCISEKAFPDVKHLVCTFGTDQTQALYQLRPQPFMPREHILDVETTQRWMSDSEVIAKHGAFYARAWEPDFGKSVTDNDQYQQNPPNSLEVTVVSGHTKAEVTVAPGRTRKKSSEFSPQKMDYMPKRIWRIIRWALLKGRVHSNRTWAPKYDALQDMLNATI